MIDTEFSSEERFARLSITYDTAEEKECVSSHVDSIIAKYAHKPEEIYTTKVASGKEVLVIEYHDCDHKTGDIFEEIMKSLKITAVHKDSTMNLEEYAKGNELFRNYFKKNKDSLLKLVKSGQSPKALFIGCSDSRVIPDLMVQTNPGDLFVIRNVGNFVPPFKPDNDFHSTASAIEYAVSVLNVGEIIICGHTHCGACEHLYEKMDDNPYLIHTKKWLELGESAKKSAILSLGANAPKEDLLRLTEKLSVIKQIENILTYPNVQQKFEQDELHIHGWCYDIETGTIEYYNADTYEFLPLKDLALET